MLFDSGCVICGETPGPVCKTCRGTLTPAAPVQVPGVDVCRVGFRLDDDSRAIVAAFKYRGQRRIARWLAAELGACVPRGADVISWVPATPQRRRRRGFDQAQQLALALSAQSGIPAVGLIGRDRSDQRQTGLSRQERLAGPTLHAVRPSPGFVVLVDDVITTGSSMSAAAQIVRSSSTTPTRQRIIAVAAAATPSSRESALSTHEWV